MINMKHTTKIIDIVNFTNADIIVGNASVVVTHLPAFVCIQFQIKGKFVFNLIQSSHESFPSGACSWA